MSCDILPEALDKDCVIVRVVLFFTYGKQIAINTATRTLNKTCKKKKKMQHKVNAHCPYLHHPFDHSLWVLKNRKRGKEMEKPSAT